MSEVRCARCGRSKSALVECGQHPTALLHQTGKLRKGCLVLGRHAFVPPTEKP